MQKSVKTPSNSQRWTYASLIVIDGKRQLKPTHVSFDRIYFAEPARLLSNQVEIVLVNGDEEQRQMATVLAHHPDATRIPIQLIAEPKCG